MKTIQLVITSILLQVCALSSLGAMDVSKNLVRSQFFSDITKYNEDDFRAIFGWNTATKTLQDLPPDMAAWINTAPSRRGPMPKSLHTWINEYPRRAAIFAGTVDMYTLGQIDTNLNKRARKPLGKPRFRILLQNPEQPTLTDVRTLVALPENKNAGFQVASTFLGMLEGGIDNPEAEVTDMLKAAAQGEELSILTAPATIYRKYFYPQGYLLEALSDKVPLITKKGKRSMDSTAVLNYKQGPNDKLKVGVGLHKGAVVASGHALKPFGKPSPTDEHLRMPIVVQKDGTIDPTKTQTINLLFTAAYSIRNNPDLAQDPVVSAFCQMLLNASYEATLKSLVLTREPKVFLTLMGAAAFANPIHWVGNALMQPVIAETIIKYGLDVSLIYRRDRKKHRNAQDDAVFLYQMFTLADTVNGTTRVKDNGAELQDAIFRYTKALYSENDQEAAQLAEALMLFQKKGILRINVQPTKLEAQPKKRVSPEQTKFAPERTKQTAGFDPALVLGYPLHTSPGKAELSQERKEGKSTTGQKKALRPQEEGRPRVTPKSAQRQERPNPAPQGTFMEQAYQFLQQQPK